MPNVTLPRPKAHAQHTSHSSRGPRRTPTPLEARRRARALSSGRRRAAARVAARTFAPHPGWRNFIEPGWRVIEDQREALQLIDELVDAEDWRCDKREAWSAILHALVHNMDWTTGLVTAVTLERLGNAGSRARRTVTRVLAWARTVGLLVVVEKGASASFLRQTHGRTPTYVMVTAHSAQNVQVKPPVDESGALPHSQVDQKPSNRQGPQSSSTNWPLFGIPTSPAERTAATQSLLQRLGLDRRGVSGLPMWRLRALLKPWWDDGMSPAGLLYAMHHHPDRPGHRGDVLRDARSPLAVLGHRLAVWRGRVHELPPAVVGQRGDYVAARRIALERRIRTAEARQLSAPAIDRRSPAAEAARRTLSEHLAILRARRRQPGRSMGRRGADPHATPPL